MAKVLQFFQEKLRRLREWQRQKEILASMQVLPKFSEHEVWWCGVGENIGSEINGKGKSYSRPVLILRKTNNEQFVGLPFTTGKHTGKNNMTLVLDDKEQVVCLSQVRSLSARRLYKKMGELPESDYENVKERFLEIFI